MKLQRSKSMFAPLAVDSAMRTASATNPVRPIAQDPEDEGVLGAGLDADAVGPLHVAPGDGDQQATDERHAGEVTDEGVGLVGAPVEELHPLRQLVVDLEDGGDPEQHEEAEVDQRVHEPRRRVAQQGPHVHAGAVVAEAAGGVGGGGAPGRGGAAALPVPRPFGEAQRPPHEHHRDQRVEGDLQRSRHPAEHHTTDRAVVVPAGDQRHDARQHGERGDGQAEPDDRVVRTQLERFVGRGLGGRLGVCRARS